MPEIDANLEGHIVVVHLHPSGGLCAVLQVDVKASLAGSRSSGFNCNGPRQLQSLAPSVTVDDNCGDYDPIPWFPGKDR